jgi:hypothetical protein
VRSRNRKRSCFRDVTRDKPKPRLKITLFVFLPISLKIHLTSTERVNERIVRASSGSPDRQLNCDRGCSILRIPLGSTILDRG